MPLLQTTTAEGALKGMVMARAAHELGDQECAYLQDALVNQPGLVSRRGAIQGATAITAANIDSMQPSAICTTFDAAGVQKIGVIYFKATGSLMETWMAVFDSSLNFLQKHMIVAPVAATAYPNRPAILNIAAGIDGSVIISVRQTYTRVAQDICEVVKWYGCSTPASTRPTAPTNAVTLNLTKNSAVVTGLAAEIAKLSVGAVLSGVGIVASVDSTTQVTLVEPYISATGSSLSLTYGIVERMGIVRARGAITVAAGATTAVGYGTKWTEAFDNALTLSGNMSVLDPKDGSLIFDKLVGVGVASDTVANVSTVFTAASLRDYIMQPGSSSFLRRLLPSNLTTATPYSAKGNLWATYKDYMVSFNGIAYNVGFTYNPGETKVSNRGWIHGPRIPEIMDHSVADGDWFTVPSSQPGDEDGIAVVGGRNACVLLKQREAYALTGDTPDDFARTKIGDDGALSCEAVATYKGDAIWLGKTGIWRFDGESAPVNITADTLGDRWVYLLSTFDTKSATADGDGMPLNYARCFVYRDHLFVNIGNTNPAAPTHAVWTDGLPTASTPMQLMIYLPTGAVSFLSNFNFRGFAMVGSKGYTMLPQASSTTHYFFPVDNIFSQGVSATDAIQTAQSPVGAGAGGTRFDKGPWFHIESRKFDAGDGLWKKSWKQLAIEFLATNTKRAYLSTVPGLQADMQLTAGTRAALPYTGTGSFLAARVKFRTRDQYISFRLYEDIANRPSTLTLGAWQWGYKYARRGAV